MGDTEEGQIQFLAAELPVVQVRELQRLGHTVGGRSLRPSRTTGSYREATMESWRKVWRDGVAPLLGVAELTALADGLRRDDPALMQGGTTTPPPLVCVMDWPVESACVIGYAGWKGAGLNTVAEVEEFFARMCFEIDQRMQEPAGCRWFLNFWDETPRAELFALVLPEIERVLANHEEGTHERTAS